MAVATLRNPPQLSGTTFLGFPILPNRIRLLEDYMAVRSLGNDSPKSVGLHFPANAFQTSRRLPGLDGLVRSVFCLVSSVRDARVDANGR